MEVRLNAKRILVGGACIVVFALFVETGAPLAMELSAIRLYQRIGSPVMSHFVTCRFNPTCSHYAVAVLEKDGFWRGNWAITKRLVRCSPVGLILD